MDESELARLAKTEPKMRDEPQAFKRACIRMGYEAATRWRPIETAPKDGTAFIADIPGSGADNVIGWTGALIGSDGEDAGGWTMLDEQEPPESWSDGVCWAVNEDGEPSVPPTRWKPLTTPPKPSAGASAGVNRGEAQAQPGAMAQAQREGGDA